VCNNILRESYRTRARTRALEDLQIDPADESASPDGALLAAETKKQVQKVLSRLGPKDRKLLHAVFFAQRDKDEVCRELGVSRDYLRVLLHRAKQQFMAQYKHVSAPPRKSAGKAQQGRVA
jgi:RNA polymerase sigma-70 factor (ECF subfamily)